MLAGLF